MAITDTKAVGIVTAVVMPVIVAIARAVFEMIVTLTAIKHIITVTTDDHIVAVGTCNGLFSKLSAIPHGAIGKAQLFNSASQRQPWLSLTFYHDAVAAAEVNRHTALCGPANRHVSGGDASVEHYGVYAIGLGSLNDQIVTITSAKGIVVITRRTSQAVIAAITTQEVITFKKAVDYVIRRVTNQYLAANIFQRPQCAVGKGNFLNSTKAILLKMVFDCKGFTAAAQG